MKSKFVGVMSVLALIVVLIMGTGVVSAQDDAGDLVNTITVTGTGVATGSPDIANIEIGVENVSPNVSEAFTLTNTAISTVVESLVALGIAREDIRTVGLNVYSQEFYPMEPMSTGDSASQVQREYRVSNMVRVTVRDITMVEAVLDTAISNGANNLYGLTFGISDRDTLEQTARADAMDNARERAAQLAELMGATLGDAIIVVESNGGFGPFDVSNYSMMDEAQAMGGSASVETGQLSVTVSIQVTFRVVR